MHWAQLTLRSGGSMWLRDAEIVMWPATSGGTTIQTLLQNGESGEFTVNEALADIQALFGGEWITLTSLSGPSMAFHVSGLAIWSATAGGTVVATALWQGAVKEAPAEIIARFGENALMARR